MIEYDDPSKKPPNSRSSPRRTPTRSSAGRRGSAVSPAVLGPLLMTTPPQIGSKRPGDLFEQLRLAWRFRGLSVRTVGEVTRLLTMSVANLLARIVESDEVRAVMAVDGLIGTWAGPHEPGTAYVMAHHEIGDVGDGTLGSWGVPEGGMGAVATAIERSARSFGAEIRTDAAVDKILSADGRARGVVLRGGEELLAPTVVTACHPKITFLASARSLRASRGLRRRHRALVHALRRRQDQLRDQPAAHASPANPSGRTSPADSRSRHRPNTSSRRSRRRGPGARPPFPSPTA